MSTNAMLGFIGTLIGGAACFCLGYHCALKWVAAELERMGTDLDGHDKQENVAS